MRKQANILKGFWNQIIIWLPLFLIPILYTPHGHTSWKNDLSIYIIPLSMMAVAYINYFIFAPMLLKGSKKEFWGINTLLIIFLSVIQHEWLYYISAEQNLMTYPYQILQGISTYTHTSFSLFVISLISASVLALQHPY